MRYRADAVALTVALIWGTSFVIQKVALVEIPPLPFTCVRYLGMLVLAWSFSTMRRRGDVRALLPRREDLAMIALAGVLGYTCYITLSTLGLSYTTAFSNALLIAIAPIYMALLLAALGMERMRPLQWIGLALSVSGMTLFVSQTVGAGMSASMIGDLISLVAAGAFAGYTVCTKSLLARYPLDLVIAYTLTVGALPIIVLALPSTFHVAWKSVDAAGWLGLAWSTVIPVYVAWTLWGWAVSRLGVARTSLYLYIVPIAGGVTSWLALGEDFGVEKLLGGAIILAGIALARRAERIPQPQPAHAGAER